MQPLPCAYPNFTLALGSVCAHARAPFAPLTRHTALISTLTVW